MLFAGDDHSIVDALGRDAPSMAIDVVGYARSAGEARALAADLSPDVVLLDLEAPAMGGTAAIGLLKAQPGFPIVFVLSSEDTLFARTQSFAAGADGFVTKTEPGKLRALLAKVRPYL